MPNMPYIYYTLSCDEIAPKLPHYPFLNDLLVCVRRKYRQQRNLFVEGESQACAERSDLEFQRALLLRDIVALRIP